MLHTKALTIWDGQPSRYALVTLGRVVIKGDPNGWHVRLECCDTRVESFRVVAWLPDGHPMYCAETFHSRSLDRARKAFRRLSRGLPK